MRSLWRDITRLHLRPTHPVKLSRFFQLRLNPVSLPRMSSCESGSKAGTSWLTPLPTTAPTSTSDHADDTTNQAKVFTYLVVVPDLEDSHRLSVRPDHLKVVQEGFKNRRIANCGAILDSDPSESNNFEPNMKGSWLLIKATSIEEARQLCLNDIFAKEPVWDLSKLEIKPVKSMV